MDDLGANNRNGTTLATRTITSRSTPPVCARSMKRHSTPPRGSTFGPKEVIWLVVGDLAKVEAGIRDLKFGEVIRLEAH